MYKQILDPVSHSLGLSAIFAVLPLILLFVLLGVARMKAWLASLVALAVAAGVAVVVYGMPVGQTGDAALEGAVFGLWPIMWIVVNALGIYNMTVETGYAAVLRRAFSAVSDDIRIQAVVVAFCFGALLEALAGFGTPVAIAGAMLVALGLSPMRAAVVALVADTAPVAFGAIAVPITTLADVTKLPFHHLSMMVGRQTPFLALLIPFVIVLMVGGRRGLRETWPAALTAGLSFAVTQFAVSNYVSTQLTDIMAALVSAGTVVVLLQFWGPHAGIPLPAIGGRPAIAGAAVADDALALRVRADGGQPLTKAEMVKAFAPYAIIVAILGIISLNAVSVQLDKATSIFAWPGLHVLNGKGKAPSSETFKLTWLTATGTWLLVSGMISAIVLRVRPGRAVRIWGRTVVQLRTAIVTVCAVLALAYVMNLSGQTATLGEWVAGAGTAVAFLSPLIGWFGTAVTGSDTSTNALFGGLQVVAAHRTGLSPTLLAAANSSGGVMAKMVSPQNLAIAAAAVGLAGHEGDILRRVLPWSVALVLVMGVLVLLQSGVLSFMVP
jgi:lactate permease